MTPYHADDWLTVYQGDCREVMRQMEPESVHCVVTSPPYWGLRDYGTATWVGGDEGCDHIEKRSPQNLAKLADMHAPRTNPRNPNRADDDQIYAAPFKGSCGKCGATRVDSQLGLEATPEEFVANMVDVFREVRRVLRSDGTCWVNLGDSYAANGVSGLGIKGDTSTLVGTANAAHTAQAKTVPNGLKPKDLVGIPWRVAFALQQPYYAGKIKDERDRIWLAAMVDGEGCIHIHRRGAGSSAHSTFTKKDGTVSSYTRKTDTYGVMVSVDNTSLAIVDRCQSIAGGIGSRYVHEAGVGKSNRRQTLYRWTVTGQQARELARELYPHLVAKQQQARIAYHSPSSGNGAHEAHVAVKGLHNGIATSLDYPAPPTLLEPGWYLRSEIIWGKLNPMPESVTDRPTKAHEQVFLLTKSPRYYYDADAVREDGTGRTAGNRGPVKGAGNDDPFFRTREGFEKVADKPWAARNLRTVWNIATQPYPGAHFATFPPKLVEPCIKAGTSERGVCGECGAPWVREVAKGDLVHDDSHRRLIDPIKRDASLSAWSRPGGKVETVVPNSHRETTTTGWRPSCAHEGAGRYVLGLEPHVPVPAVVLDPFAGSGTTGMVAQRLGRRAVLIDLSGEYLVQAMGRNNQTPLGLIG